MPKQPKYRTVPGPVRSELQQFASWFHQDFGLMKMTVHEGARTYFGSLTTDRSKALRSELQAFVVQHGGSPESLRKAWLAQGAEYWPRAVDLQETLRMFAEGKFGGGA
jgi:hypothetical protein